jgi:glutamate racemase
VLREIVARLPTWDVAYLADSAHVPYGERQADEIRALARGITRFLVGRGAVAIVVACNTASAAALYHLRERFEQPIVGMEPAVKPAVERTQSQHVGVMATQATFQGVLFASLVARFGGDATIHTQACPGLVEQVEAGRLNGAGTEALLRRCLEPLLAEGIDSLVLGCTHYPFLRPAIEGIVGPGVAIIDPAPAVARQVARVVAPWGGSRPEGEGRVTFFASGDAAAFEALARRLVDVPGPVVPVRWAGDGIVYKEEASWKSG